MPDRKMPLSSSVALLWQSLPLSRESSDLFPAFGLRHKCSVQTHLPNLLFKEGDCRVLGSLLFPFLSFVFGGVISG